MKTPSYIIYIAKRWTKEYFSVIRKRFYVLHTLILLGMPDLLWKINILIGFKTINSIYMSDNGPNKC